MELERGARAAAAARRSWPRWIGQWRSAGGAPPTCGAHPRRRARDSRPPARRGRAHPGPARRPGPAAGRLHDREPSVTAAPPPLAPDLAAGLRRLKLAAMRQPRPRAADHREDAAVGTRGAAAHPGRGRDHRPRRLQRPDPAQGRRVPGHQDPGRVRPQRVLDPRPRPWTTSRPWNGSPPARTSCLVGPAGTGKSHLLVALGAAAVARRAQGPLPHRRRPGRDPLPRPGRQLRRQDHRHPAPQRPDHHRRSRASPRWTTPAPSCCSASSPPPTNAAPSASPATGRSTSGAGSCPSTPPPSACSTGSCTTPASWSPTATPTACAKPEPKEEPHREELTNPRGGDFYLATSGDRNLAVDTPPE